MIKMAEKKTITVEKEGYIRKAHTREINGETIEVKEAKVPPTTYEMVDLGKPGKTPEEEKWFEPKTVTGWKKTDPQSVRLKKLLEASKQLEKTTIREPYTRKAFVKKAHTRKAHTKEVKGKIIHVKGSKVKETRVKEARIKRTKIFHSRYVQAGRMAQQLANITVDPETKKKAQSDADKLFAMARRMKKK